MNKLKGIVPVFVSPMDENGSPDTSGIKALVNHVIAGGAGGIWLLGSTGEDLNIRREDRLTLVREVANENKGRIPIITGTGASTVTDCLDFIESLDAAPLDGIHHLYLDHKQSDRNVIAQMQQLADRSPYPVWLYHNPKRGKPLSLDVVKSLRDHDNVAGMKLGGYSLTEMTNALMLEREDFQVIGAGGGQCFTMMALGATAHTASEACSRASLFADMFDTFNAGDISGARDRQFDIIRLNQSILKTAFVDNGESAAEEKYFLKLQGICDEYVNPAYRTLNDEEKASIATAMKTFGLLDA